MLMSYIQGPPNNTAIYCSQLQNVPGINSFCSPSQYIFSDCRSNDDSGSTISESSSTSFSPVPTSSESGMEDESQSIGADPIAGSNWYCDYGTPQMVLERAVPQAYRQVTYHPQNQSFPLTQSGAAFPSYVNILPYQLQVAPMTTSGTYPVQYQHVAHPVQLQQNLTTQQNLTVPASTTVLTSVADPMLYSPTSNTTGSPNQSPSSLLNGVSATTPVGCLSMPGYVNSYGYVNPSLVSSTPSTPMPCAMQSSVAPSSFHLSNSPIYTNTVPRQITCRINPTPVPSVIHNSEKTSTRVSDKMEVSKPYEKESDNLWQGNCSYKECNLNGGSNLFVTWNGTESELRDKLLRHKLEVRIIFRSCDECIFNVIFENHLSARKAFLLQREIRLRMVPPKGSHRNWLRNPSPNFLVKFETRCRLVVKKGKAECHDIVGDLLMSNCQQHKGCIIWADQLKGHRIRVVSCEGNFMFPGGRVVEMKGVPTDTDKQTSLGWISYRCRYTRESFVSRRSGNKLGDYIYTE